MSYTKEKEGSENQRQQKKNKGMQQQDYKEETKPQWEKKEE